MVFLGFVSGALRPDGEERLMMAMVNWRGDGETSEGGRSKLGCVTGVTCLGATVDDCNLAL